MGGACDCTRGRGQLRLTQGAGKTRGGVGTGSAGGGPVVVPPLLEMAFYVGFLTYHIAC